MISRRNRITIASTALAGIVLGGTVANAQTIPIYPGVTSDNVTFMGNFPDSTMISSEFALTGDFFYASSLDSIAAFSYVIDGDNITVTLEGMIADLKFENESMTYGERRDDAGNVTDRFVIVAEDLFHVDPVAATDTHVGGDNVVIIDVTDASNPFLRSQAEIATSTHTVQCLSRLNCDYAYAVGGRGVYSIVDLRDLDNPVEVSAIGASADEATGLPRSPAAGPNAIFSTGAGHYWDIDDAGIAWQTGSGGAAAFDVTNPLDPVILNATDATGTQSPYNDFILHNSNRPNALAFDADRPDGNEPSLAKGNILFVTEEDYANDGDEILCSETGEFSSWFIPSLDNKTYLAGAGDEPFRPNGGSITHLDSFHPVRDGEGSPIATPVDTFCSAHWFDYHETGIIAGGYYAAGLYLVDVRDPADMHTYGYATTKPSEVWDAYWFPQRDADGVDTGLNTSFVMTADNVRGVDVFRVDVPAEIIEPDISGSAAPAPEPAPEPAPAPEPTPTRPLPATGAGFAVLALGLAIGASRRRRGGA